MSDASPLVPWITATLGCVVSYGVAHLSPRPSSLSATLFAGAKAFALSIALFFAGSLMHALCIDQLHQCSSHGDGNIKYAMGGILAFPIYWLIFSVSGKGKWVKQAPSLLSRCESASSEAIMDHIAGKVASSQCPACADIISTRKCETASSGAQVATRCRCGRCNRIFQLRVSEA